MTAHAIHNRPIRQPDARGFSEALRLTGLTFIVAAPFILYVGLSANMIKEEYRLSKLVADRSQLVRDRERLTLQRAALLSPEIVVRTAREKLDMVDEDPQEMTVGVVPDRKPEDAGAGGSLTKPGPAKPARANRTRQPHGGQGSVRAARFGGSHGGRR